jgi:nicotinamidase-related amidase
MNPALLIIDVQKEYIGYRKSEPLYRETFEYINHVSGLFRDNGKRIYIIRHIESGDGELFGNVEELVTDGSEKEILKKYGNAFWKTNLEQNLRDDGVDFLVLCGNAAEYCVLATYNGAVERGFRAAFLQNGVFSASETGRLDMALNRPLISYQVISYILQNGQ